MIFEFCIEDFEALKSAERNGIHRVELCTGLSVGGLTPSLGLIRKCSDYSKIEIHVLIRPREGDFMYSNDEFEVIKNDLVVAANAGAEGVVVGCLTQEGEIELEKNKELVMLAKSLKMEITFHRAFDFCLDPFIALEKLIELGFDRILTSGQEESAEKGIPMLTQLVNQAQGRIQIMAGGRVNEANAELIASSGVDALHFSVHTKVLEPLNSMGGKNEINEAKINNILRLFV